MITGSSGKTTTTNMLARILQDAGYVVGKTTTEGIYINNICVWHGDAAGYKGAWWVMTEPGIGAAVLETARGDLLAKGRPYLENVDVAAITNIGNVHIGFRGINSLGEMAALKNNVLRAAKSAVVVNADDKYCIQVVSEYSAEMKILISTDSGNVHINDHLRSGGRAVTLKTILDNKCIVYEQNGTQEMIVVANDIPSTMDGLLEFNIYNAMVASGLAIGLSLSPREISRGLTNFSLNEEDNPGRFTFVAGYTPRILVNFGSNAFKLEPAIRAIDGLSISGRRLCLVTCPEDRNINDLKGIASALAHHFDEYYLCDFDQYAGEKNLGSSLAKIEDSLLALNVMKEQITFHKSLTEAICAAFRESVVDDLIVIFGQSMYSAKVAIEEGACSS
jgi:cyanophycin synthetase